MLLAAQGSQLEIKARLLSGGKPEWGVVVFGSADLAQGCRIGFNAHHFFVDRTRSGEPSRVAERDVRAGPLPRSTAEQSVHIFADRSIISVIASNETAITVWTHPLNSSTHVGLFSVGGADVELEAWEMGGI